MCMHRYVHTCIYVPTHACNTHTHARSYDLLNWNSDVLRADEVNCAIPSDYISASLCTGGGGESWVCTLSSSQGVKKPRTQKATLDLTPCCDLHPDFLNEDRNTGLPAWPQRTITPNYETALRREVVF